MTNIIGISSLYHDSSCCLLQDGVLRAAVSEERFTRIKHDPSMPYHALMHCLKEGKVSIKDIDCLAYYENPEKKLARQLWSGALPLSKEMMFDLSTQKVENQIREFLGYEGPIKFVDHHKSHAASSFFFSGFKEAAILTVDGVGEWSTTAYGIGKNNHIDFFEEVDFPHSLGLLYSTITSFLGFEVNEGEYKIMGLAPYGKPVYLDEIYELISLNEGGQFKLNMKYFDFLAGDKMYSDEMEELIGFSPRRGDDELSQFHMDLAHSIQVALEQILLSKIKYLHSQTGAESLCMAGGVALNCVANSYLLKHGPFKKLFIHPAANDAGGAVGAAAEVYSELCPQGPPIEPIKDAYLGPEYKRSEILQLLEASPIKFNDYHNDESAMLKFVAQELSEGKVVGWFQGKMEFGPRALGARSILADPRDPGMKDRINALVKMREGFRPFAPVTCLDKATVHFDLDHPSPYMLETCEVISHISLPAITHVDLSARVQTVSKEINSKLYNLISEFESVTGCPILLNTSFNIKGQPIVCTPVDAIKCFITTNIDYLVLEDIVLDRSSASINTLEYLINLYEKTQTGITYDVYTFI